MNSHGTISLECNSTNERNMYQSLFDPQLLLATCLSVLFPDKPIRFTHFNQKKLQLIKAWIQQYSVPNLYTTT